MSNYTTIPDAIVFPDGTIRLVTRAAKDFAYSSTDIGTIHSLSTASAVPDYLDFESSIPQMLADAGLVVKQERQPVFHYRSKRRRWPKSTTSSDGKVIQLSSYRTSEQCQVVAQRGYTRFLIRRHRRMQEHDDKRKRQEVLTDEKTSE